MLTLFATCPRGVEPALAGELGALGASAVKAVAAGIAFEGDLGTALRVCLWSRTASRVLLALARVPASSADELYGGVLELPWEEHVSPDGTLAVDFRSDANQAFRNSMFGAQRTKDAVVDRLRDRFGRRPSVDASSPDVRINVRVRERLATVSLDLSGDALHRRGYRLPGRQTEAPLKENLAAAMLILAGWPQVAAGGGALLDPFCGSGTLLIEGAWMAGDTAPGLLRSRWGFAGWLGRDDSAWDALLAEADERSEEGLATLPPIEGGDADASAIQIAVENVARAGLKGRVALAVADVASVQRPARDVGLVACNPPYGVRLGEASGAPEAYRTLGERLLDSFQGWNWATLSQDDSAAAGIGIVPRTTHRLYNGAVPVRLDAGEVPLAEGGDSTGGKEAFRNRLRKNARHLGKWARREGIACWRAYDADLPDYSVAIDVYDCSDGVRRLVVAEYEAPPEVDTVKAQVRLKQAVEVSAGVLDANPAEVRVKVRRRQRGTEQYERVSARGVFFEVPEGEARLLVNLDDYIDTGLFPDHRLTREMVARLARGGSLLNLFCYTGAATVVAGLAGADRTVSVDMSNTYLEWARRNLELNGLRAPAHELVRADVTAMLRNEQPVEAHAFDVVFLDPPSFSSGAAMEGTLDVQRDHVGLIAAAADWLKPHGTMVFSTNLRTFRLDEGALLAQGLQVEDVSAGTIPPDFARDRRIHQCFLVSRGTQSR